MPTDRPPTIDPQAARRWRALPQAQSAWLHDEVGRRMEARLAWIKQAPETWVHWEPVSGGLKTHALLATRYPDAQCLMVEPLAGNQLLAIKSVAKPWWHPGRWKSQARCLPEAPDGGAQMLWANMALHMAADPQALIGQWHRAIAVDGFLMFSCLGPDTLRELRDLYQSQGWPEPAHLFTDMHDWGDMLVQAGFAEPVMDMERITLSFDTPQRLLRELRELGRNLNLARSPGLRGRGWLAQLHEAMSQQLAHKAEQGRLTLTFEVIYGHAFKPKPRIRMGPETVLSLDEMRETLRKRENG